MDKVKVSKEVAKAIDYVKSNYSFERVMAISTGKGFIYEESIPLNTLDTETLATAILVGYEVELTKEELLFKEFDNRYETACTTPRMELQARSNGFMEGMKFTLNILGLKVPGITD